jgi:uncharacterized protein (TIGR02145 family)
MAYGSCFYKMSKAIVPSSFYKNDRMRKLLFLTALFISLNSNAQDYNITFTGTGSSSAVGSIIVENLTSGLSLTLNGSDILHLTGTVGISRVEDMQLSGIKIYPNPLTENSLMEFYPPSPGDATISVYDMTGKPVAHIRGYLENTRQVFRLSGIKSGLYLVNIEGKSYRLSGKLLSTISAGSKISIERTGRYQTPEEKEYINDAKGSAGTVDMAYSEGERLKFTGISGDFSTVKIDIPTEDKTITFNFMPCTDGDNNHYPVVEIGTQVWMAENLKTTTFNGGYLIGTTTPATLDISSEIAPIYQWAYDGNENNALVYGRLYTWYAATDSRNLCPAGWYVPTDADTKLMSTFLGGGTVSGGKLKEIGTGHWASPNTGGSDEAGFRALPGGIRYNSTFIYIDSGGYWCNSKEYSSVSNWYSVLFYDYPEFYKGYSNKKNGYSVRCMKVTYPIVVTTPVTTFSFTTADVGGDVTSFGGATVTERGVFWGTSQNPVTSGTKLQIGSGTGIFSANLTGLNHNTTYYVRAYAVNSVGTSYGEEVNFKTNEILAPSLTTKSATSITQAKAISGGNITSDGGAAVTARGVCWSSSENPTIADNHTSDGSGTGSFTSYLHSLSHSTTYYIRAYATNITGTAYGDQVSFTTLSGGPIVFNPALTYGIVTDIEGNEYKTIQAGTMVLMAENLRTKRYNDNTPIPSVTDNTNWKNLTTPAYCWFDNDSATYKYVYGALYNWYAVNTGKLCPAGWHVPSNEEYMTLVTIIGGMDVAGGKMKESGTTHWLSPNTGATNESGFTGLPGGRRYYYDGTFIKIGELGFFWTSTEDEVVYGGIGILHYDSAALEGDGYSKPNGMSVRCIK